MTNKYLEKIASSLSKEASRRVEVQSKDNWEHAPKSTALATGSAVGSIAASGKSLYHDVKGMTGSGLSIDNHIRKSRRALGASLGLLGVAIGSGIYSGAKTRKALDKKYEVRKRK